jgi:ADP-heptose:LPS heptosyltransferase/GT2 family glycosyltransferase
MNDKDRKRIIREKIQRAMQRKPSSPYKYGSDTKKIYKALRSPSIVSKEKNIRPLKVNRIKNNHDPKTLVTTPEFEKCLALEFPTPPWFAKTNNPLVSVIVPLYKSQEVIHDFIRSWNIKNTLDVELIFVDDHCPNHSKDVVIKECLARKDEWMNGVGKIVAHVNNCGFGTACNTGAAYASGKYLVFINADTVLTPTWLSPIIKRLEDTKIGIVGNLQLKHGGMWHGSIDSAGSEWSWQDMCFVHIGRHIYQNKQLKTPFFPDQSPKDILTPGTREMVTGCCIGIRKELFLEIGGFNPNYRIGYWEDSDICMTVQEKGYQVFFEPTSVIYHKLGHTGSGHHRHHDFNRNYFINKWVNSGRIDQFVSHPRQSPLNIKNILIKRNEANGDVLVAAAVAPALKKKYPGCKILFHTRCKEIVENNPFIDRIIDDVEVSERLFQVFYNLDMVYESRPYTNLLQSYADAVGVNIEDCKTHLTCTPISLPITKEYVVIHAGKTAWTGRDWEENKFSEIAQKLLSQGKNVVCIGTKSDGLVPCNIDLRGKTTINQLATVMKNAKLFIGIDSFPMHVAQTFDIPGVCFFGSVSPQTRIYSKNMQGITAQNLPCLGCHHRNPAPCTVTNNCETGTLDCIKLVSINDMWDAISLKLV